MKKSLQLFFGASVLLSVNAWAQPTLTATGINAVVGDILSIANSTVSVSPGSAGAGQTWNLSALTGSAASNTVVTVSSTPNAASFPNANISLKGASYYAYYKTSSTAWQNYGSATTVVMPYSDPEDFLHFPFTYNNTFTDTWAAVFTNTYTFYRKGSTTVTADGYGTVTTPAGTFNNALRVHFVQTYQDSAYVGTPYVITYQNDEYMWYLNGNHTPIATVYTLTTSGNPSPGGSYLTNAVNGINDQVNLINNCLVSPNPAVEQINLDFDLAQNKHIEIKLFNSLGASVSPFISAEGLQGSNRYKLDVSTLPEGPYFIQVHLDGTPGTTRKFVISR